MNPVLWGILAYVLAQLLVGFLVSRRITSEADYLLAGRSLGYGLATFSFFATWFGAETCISAAGSFYEHGLSGGSADPFGYGACLLLMGLVFAVPLWRRGLTTLADLFRQRYSVGVERTAVLLMAPTSVFWAAAQIRAFGQVLDATSGIGVSVGITVAAVVVIAYTVSGGLRADVVTDLIQGIVIILGLICLAVAVWGSFSTGELSWGAIDRTRLRLVAGNGWLATFEDWAIPICGSVVAQELVSRALAARSPQVAQRSALMGGGLYLAFGMIPAFIGLVAVQIFPNLQDPEQVLPLFAQRHLPTFFYILFAGALVSAILSTVDSTLLAASALVSHNLILPLMPSATEKTKVRTARLGVVVAGIIAYGMALKAGTIYSLVESASSFGSAGIFIIMVLGLFTRWGGKVSAMAALLCGTVVWLLAHFLWDLETPYLLSLGAALVAYAAGSFFNWRESASEANHAQ